MYLNAEKIAMKQQLQSYHIKNIIFFNKFVIRHLLFLNILIHLRHCIGGFCTGVQNIQKPLVVLDPNM